MSEESYEKSVVIANKYGLHARPASLFVKTCNEFDCDVRVCKDGTTVNGKNILEIMTLGAETGSTLQLSATGPKAQEAIESLVTLIENKFNEE